MNKRDKKILFALIIISLTILYIDNNTRTKIVEFFNNFDPRGYIQPQNKENEDAISIYKRKSDGLWVEYNHEGQNC
jgi:hypothetical protein